MAAPSLTRQHFKLIADILARHHASRELVEAFASELQQTNPRFSRSRFLAACKGKAEQPRPRTLARIA